MIVSKKIRIAFVACIAAVLALSMIGCSSAAPGTNTNEQSANRKFMSDINQVIEDITTDLKGFAEALSKQDIVSMKMQAEAAGKSIADLEKVETPEGLEDIKNGYVDGCKKLQEALDQYLALYTDISEGNFDYSTYDTRLDDIKKIYDGGIQTLQDTDKKASEAE